MIPVVSRIVEVVLFRFHGDRAEYLILQRAGDQQVHPGMWQIVTGTMEEGETAVRTALREIGEETGLVPLRFWSLPGLTTFYDTLRHAVNLCPVFAAQVDAGTPPVLSAEHTAYAWLSLPAARSRLVWPSHRQAVGLVEEYIVSGQEAAFRLSLPLP